MHIRAETSGFIPSTLKPSDFSSLMTLETAAFKPGIAWSEESMLKEIETNSDGFRVVRKEGSVIAYVHTEILGPNRGTIGSIAVAQDYRRQGIGKVLLIEGIRLLDEKGVSQIELNTQTDNLAMMNLAIELGFRFKGIREGFYKTGEASFEMERISVKPATFIAPELQGVPFS